MIVLALVHYALALVLAPLLLGIINRTKAFFAGRAGPPLLQGYYDLWKLLHKGAVYSRTTTWVFRAGPIISLAAVLAALLLVPFGGCPALVAFPGDFLLLAYLLGLARFVTVSAALDTGSSFEGMGASREVLFSALAEPALLLSLAAIGRETLLLTQIPGAGASGLWQDGPGAGASGLWQDGPGAGASGLLHGNTGLLSLSDIHQAMSPDVWVKSGLILGLVLASLIVVLLVENSRIPVDDPNTHLELTMVHEVMVLDHGGPDFAFILYGAALKLWLLGSLLIGLTLPRWDIPVLDNVLALGSMLGLAVLVGVIESSMARLRLPRVPQLLIGAAALAALAFILERHGGMP